MRPSMRVLRDEHRALRGIARILKMDGEIVAGGGEIDTGVLRDIVRYLREFPNRIHHPKEEAFLFKALRARHREAAGLLDRLGHEHEAEEQKVEALSAAVESFERGEDGAGKRLAEAASGYGEFLESHITLEDEEVFPLAERVLGEEDWKPIDAAFAVNRDPLAGARGEAEALHFRDLHRRIMLLGAPPIGMPRIKSP